MTRRRADAGPVMGRLAAGVFIGASLWLSQGVLALVDPTRVMRIGALPSWSWLAASCVAGAALALLARLPSDALAPLLVLGLVWLPWLPARVPAAFLMWDGPLEGLVWACAIGGVMWLSRARWAARPWPVVSAARAPLVAGLVSAIIFASAWIVIRPRVPSGDEPHYLIIAQSLLNDGDLKIENNHREYQYLAYFEGALKPDFMQRGRDRQIYSIHAPGTAVVVAPAFLLAGYRGAVLFVVMLAALGMAIVWRVGYLVTGSPPAAWFGWLAVTTALPVVLHASTIYPDPIGATIALVGLLVLVSLDLAPLAVVPPWRWFMTGTALALLPWLHTRFAVLAAGFGSVLALRVWRRAGGGKDLVRLLAVPALSAAAWFAYFWVIYGTVNPSAPYGRATETGLSWVPQGFAGLLLDQQFGLAVNAPILLAGIVAMRWLAQQRPRLAGELTVIGVSYLVAVTTFPMWWGGTSAPARFIVAVLPLLGLPLACAWAAGRGPTRAVLGVLLGLSAAWTVAVVGVDRGAFIHNGRDGYSLLLDWLTRTVDLTLALPSVHRDGALAALGDTLVWLVVGTLVTAGAVLATRLARPTIALAAAWLAVPIAILLATSVTWSGRDRAAYTPATSQMSFLERWYPGRAPLTMQLAPARWLTPAQVPRRLTLSSSTRGPAPRENAPLVQMFTPPAGDYDVFIDGSDALAGALEVRLGRHELTIETWRLEGRSAGYTGLTLHLPVDARSLTITGDAAARRNIRQLTLRPRTLALRTGRPEAIRAARYGRTLVYALDANAYLEAAALWVRGNSAASLVVQGDPGTHPSVRLQAGPVPNVVTLSAGTWHAEVSLAAGQQLDVPLPEAALAPATFSVDSGSGFRPSEHGSPTGDVRWLGVSVTWADAPDSAPP